MLETITWLQLMIRKVSLLKLKDLFLIPNLITISRLIASLYLFLFFSLSDFSTSMLVFLIAMIGISDSIDGIVARKLNQVSKLGTILDPVCDRTVFILLLFWLFEIFPNWFFYGVIIREILILLGSIYVLFNTKTLSVSKYGKFGTVFIFFSICFFVINYRNESVLFVYFGLTSLIFYYFVALEYFYRIIKDE